MHKCRPSWEKVRNISNLWVLNTVKLVKLTTAVNFFAAIISALTAETHGVVTLLLWASVGKK